MNAETISPPPDMMHLIGNCSTDGIVSERKLEGLARVKVPGKDRVDLGNWEYAEAESGLFVQAGVYWYGKIVEKDGNRAIKFVSKTRGGDPKKYDKEADVWKWLTDNILPKWQEPFDHRAQSTQGRCVAPHFR